MPPKVDRIEVYESATLLVLLGRKRASGAWRVLRFNRSRAEGETLPAVEEPEEYDAAGAHARIAALSTRETPLTYSFGAVALLGAAPHRGKHQSPLYPPGSLPQSRPARAPSVPAHNARHPPFRQARFASWRATISFSSRGSNPSESSQARGWMGAGAGEEVGEEGLTCRRVGVWPGLSTPTHHPEPRLRVPVLPIVCSATPPSLRCVDPPPPPHLMCIATTHPLSPPPFLFTGHSVFRVEDTAMVSIKAGGFSSAARARPSPCVGGAAASAPPSKAGGAMPPPTPPPERGSVRGGEDRGAAWGWGAAGGGAGVTPRAVPPSVSTCASHGPACADAGVASAGSPAGGEEAEGGGGCGSGGGGFGRVLHETAASVLAGIKVRGGGGRRGGSQGCVCVE